MPQPRSTKNINSDDDFPFNVSSPNRRPVIPSQPSPVVNNPVVTPAQAPVRQPVQVPPQPQHQQQARPAVNRLSVPVPQNSTTSTTKRIAEEIAKTVAETDAEYSLDDGVVPNPKPKPTRGEIVKPGSLGGRTNTSKVNTIRVPVELFNLVRAEFPTARSQDVALQAYIARHSDAESMVTNEAVKQVLSEAAESSDTMETLHKELESLRASLRNLRRETAISSMASAMVLQEMYKTQNRDKRIEDWIGLSDAFMAVMNELTSLSRDYSDEVRHAAGRIQSGYGD